MSLHIFSPIPVDECVKSLKDGVSGASIESFDREAYVTIDRYQIRVLFEEAVPGEAPNGFRSKVSFRSLVPGEATSPLENQMWEIPAVKELVDSAVMALEAGDLYFSDGSNSAQED